MALFKLGQTVATPAALAACAEAGISPLTLLHKHCTGDWGDLGKEDVKANEDAIAFDGRVLSKYKVGADSLYCITEWDRSSTTLLLTSEY